MSLIPCTVFALRSSGLSPPPPLFGFSLLSPVPPLPLSALQRHVPYYFCSTSAVIFFLFFALLLGGVFVHPGNECDAFTAFSV